MKRIIAPSTALLVASLFLSPFPGWAEMGHHGRSSQGHHGEHCHMGISDHSEPMKKIYENYFVIQSSLAEDSMEKVPARAKAIEEAIEGLQGESMKCFGRGQEDAMHDLTSDMGAAAGSLAEQKDINSARREFGKLSEYLVEYHRNHGKDHSVKVRVFVCDMAKQVWLQDSEELRNPYYGSAMLTCGRRVQ